MTDPRIIYLEPEEAEAYGTERCWCVDDDPASTGYPWIKYIRADTTFEGISKGILQFMMALLCAAMAFTLLSVSLSFLRIALR